MTSTIACQHSTAQHSTAQCFCCPSRKFRITTSNALLMADAPRHASAHQVGHSLKGDFAAIGRAAAAAAESSGDEAIEPQKGRQRQQQRSGAVAAVPVFDLSSNWHAFFGLSLANIAKAALGRTLDKSEQCSTWGLRPLTVPQRTYAAKDAAVCVSVFRQVTRQPFAVLRAHSSPLHLPVSQPPRSSLWLRPC